jgi:hypothetical protein
MDEEEEQGERGERDRGSKSMWLEGGFVIAWTKREVCVEDDWNCQMSDAVESLERSGNFYPTVPRGLLASYLVCMYTPS